MKKIPSFNTAFAEVLRAHRTRMGLTQPQLAEKIEGSELTIRTLERAKQVPTMTTFLLLCEALEVEPQAMLNEILEKL